MRAGQTPEQYLSECVTLDDLALDEEYIRTPADLAYWNARYADALRAYLTAKLAHETNAARLHLRVKADNDLGGGKKATVADLEAMVVVDPDYQRTAMAMVEADAERQRLRGSVDAIACKKDMLQSLGAKLRAEMGADPMVRAEQRRSRG